MEIAEIKLVLKSKIDQSNDNELIQYIYSLLTSDSQTIRDYPDEINQSIQTAREESLNNQVTPHEVILKKYKP